jgi:hypothetical protein
VWDENSNGWFLNDLKKQAKVQRFEKEIAEKATRLCSYFESEHNR